VRQDERVRRRLAYFVAWAVATAVTVGMSWLGIRSVLVAAAPSPLSAADLRLAAPTSAAAEPSPTPAPSPTPVPAPVVSATPKASPSAQPVETWASAPDGHGGTGYKRTFHTNGGDVSFWTAKGETQVLSQNPKPGYTVNVNRYDAESVMVSFFNNHKVSRVWARWWNGPYAEVSESVP
jgi:hypothetical protein